MSDVRVRFAPSPTGSLHIGGVRTAVFDWLFARRTGGKFLLRIEDTDRTRLVPGSLEEIMDGLHWLGLDWDEGPDVGGDCGPYMQSERLDLYQRHAQELIESGHAYYCCCTPERLAEMRKEQEARKESTGYDRHCRDLTPDEVEKCRAESGIAVVRFKMPLEGTTSVNDVVRGEITFENSLQDDFIILKSDGFPTYHFASVVDDHHMGISHVIRGEEWISSSPKHVRLYDALGWQPPVFVHAPLIVGPDRAKLSKRHGATALSLYREEGYLPEAIVNFLALLGWSPAEDRDVYSVEELIEKFSLEGIINHAAIFDLTKLQWMNGQYIRQCDLDRLTELVLPYLQGSGLLPESPTPDDIAYARRVVCLAQERMKLLAEITELTRFFFVDTLEFDPKATAKWFKHPHVPELLNRLAARFEALPEWTIESIEEAVRAAGADAGVEGGQVIHPVRVAVTGKTVGPGLFETLDVLGKDRCVARLRNAANIASQEVTARDAV